MKLTTKSMRVILALALPLFIGLPAQAAELQTIFNFAASLGPVTGNLVQGPDGNFYGTTRTGGPAGNGTIFRVTPAGVLTIVSANLLNPSAGLVVGNDGLLYGLTERDGALGFGTVFKLTTSGVLNTVATFDGVNAANPVSGLTLAPDGNFYGTSPQGGTNGTGSVFRVTPAGVVTLLVSFDGTSLGGVPSPGLTVGPDGNLYGMTSLAGANGSGTIFKVTLGGTLTTLHSFSPADGVFRQSRLALGPDQNLYGTLRDSGASNAGEIFKITTNGVFTSLVSFNGPPDGAFPYGELTTGADRQLYGTTSSGGTVNLGTVFKMTTDGALTTLFSFTNEANGQPQAGLLLAGDANFYGCSQGSVFRMTPAGVVTALVSLSPPDGVSPRAGLTLGPDGKLYGTSSEGGAHNAGTIFSLTTSGVLTTLSSFNVTNGQAPAAALTLGKDGNLYGTATLGGANLAGTAFRFSTNAALTALASFNAATGVHPQGQLVEAPDGSFVGAAPDGGLNGFGTVFRVTTNGTLTRLVSFNISNGAVPEDGLTLGTDGNFYGTTSDGGNSQLGTIFRLTPAGALTTLAVFSGANGFTPLGGLVQGPDGTLYGTTGSGGPTNAGTIFKVTTNGTGNTIFQFHFTDGSEPASKLIFGPDGNLYGTTLFGGSTGSDPFGPGLGTVFRITTNGVFTPLVLFQGTNGANPVAPLTVGSDGNLYGTTSAGGPGNGGTIFRVVLNDTFTNTPPTVAITSPANGSSFIAPATITIQATASDSDGSVTNVQFFDGVTSLGNVSSSPFNLSVSLAAGSHALIAVASDNLGATTTTLPVTVTVTSNTPPTIAITSPANGSSFIAPATITIQAAATDSDGSVTNVQFFDGDTSLGNVSSSPFNLSVTLAAGSHALIAVASDNLGATTTTLPVTVTVTTNTPPTVAITSPANGSSFIVPATITIQAAASDSDGSVTNVQFFDGTTSLGNVSSSPFNLSVSLAVGSHALTVVASDNLGATTATLPVTVTVTTNTPPTVAITSPTNGSSFIAPATITIEAAATDSDGSVTNVQFFDGDASLGNVSSSPFNLSVSLAAGSHSLIAVASDNLGAKTTTLPVTVTVTTNTPPTIAITSPANGSSFIAPATITIQAAASDSDGSVTNVQFFDGTTSLGNVPSSSFNASSSPFNLSVSLGVGSHALTAVASDNLGAKTTTLPVTVTVTTNSPPTVAIISPIDGSSFIAPATITIQTAASDSDGSVTNVQFFDGTNSLGDVPSSSLNASSSPFNLSVSLGVGSHALTAVASDNLGAKTTTLPVRVTVTTNTPPTVTAIVISDVTKLPDGSFQLAFTNAPGASFTVLTTTNSAVPVEEWTSGGTALEISPGSYQFTDETTNSPQRFYRIRSP